MNALFSITFDDGSVFTLPPAWTEVFVAEFGEDPAVHARLSERLRFIVGKYVAHRARPSKFDGLATEDEDDRKFDDPDYYFESWDEWPPGGRVWHDRTVRVPSRADIAEGVLYQHLRLGLMQRSCVPRQ